MKSESVYEKIKWCNQDIEEFKDLIQINDSALEITKRYKLLESISGKKIKNRFENLIITCWSAKDYLKKDIIEEISVNTGKVFEKNLFKHKDTDLIQYIADSVKHGGIGNEFLKLNKYKKLKPKLENVIFKLSNQSVPGELKPTYKSDSEDLFEFDIKMVKLEVDEVVYYNFDTIHLSMKIIDNENNTIGDAIDLVRDFTKKLKFEYNRIMLI